MKMTMRLTKIKKIIFFIILSLFLNVGCESRDETLDKNYIEKKIKEENYEEALRNLSRFYKRHLGTPEGIYAAQKSAEIYLLKKENFKKAIQSYRYIVLYSKDSQERIQAQEKIAFIYFEKISNYERAIQEYYKLVHVYRLSHAKIFEVYFNIAKSFYFLNKFKQSLVELDKILQFDFLKRKEQFEVELFKANVFLTTKDTQKAIDVYNDLNQRFPDFSKKAKVDMSIAIAYEDINDFSKAIDVLENMKKTTSEQDILDLKILRLKKRIENLPKVKVLKKK